MSIRDIRKQLGWSQERLAEKSGLSARTIQRVEQGEITPQKTLLKISDAMGVNLEDISSGMGFTSFDHEKAYIKLSKQRVIIKALTGVCAILLLTTSLLSVVILMEESGSVLDQKFPEELTGMFFNYLVEDPIPVSLLIQNILTDAKLDYISDISLSEFGSISLSKNRATAAELLADIELQKGIEFHIVGNTLFIERNLFNENCEI